jgi:hypothetical protein
MAMKKIICLFTLKCLLVLLYAAREMNDPASRDLAVQAGLRLVELGRAENGGLKWIQAEHRVRRICSWRKPVT